MNLQQFVPSDQIIISIAHRVKSKFPSSNGKCEYMSRSLMEELMEKGIRANHVMGIFTLDEPGAWKYRSEEDESLDEYSVNHDWVSVEGKILDISAKQFRKSVGDSIPDIVYIGHSHPLYARYKFLNYYGGN